MRVNDRQQNQRATGGESKMIGGWLERTWNGLREAGTRLDVVVGFGLINSHLLAAIG